MNDQENPINRGDEGLPNPQRPSYPEDSGKGIQNPEEMDDRDEEPDGEEEKEIVEDPTLTEDAVAPRKDQEKLPGLREHDQDPSESEGGQKSTNKRPGREDDERNRVGPGGFGGK